jgi:hypothetical protein
MLRQYQLHGGIRRLQTRFDQSKQFGTTTTMAASAALTPWDRPPPSIGKFRWWEEDFLKLSRPLTSKEATIVHRTKYSCEPPHGVLVPALKELVSHLDEPHLKKSPGSETLKTVSFSCPQTTHFHRVRRIQRNRPRNSSNNPIPPSEGDYCLPNQGVDLQGRKPRRCYCRDRGYSPSHLHPPLTNRHLTLNTLPVSTRVGQEILRTGDPCDIYGCYSEIFCSSTMTRDDEDETKVDTTLPRSRSRSCSATKSHHKSGPSILEVLNCKKTWKKTNRWSKKSRLLPPSR